MFVKIDVSPAVINRHLRSFETFRRMDVEMPIGQIIFFMYAAKMQGASLREIADAADVKMTTASRYLSNLSERDRFKQKGLGLLTAYENPENRRMKCINLTDAGHVLLMDLGDAKAYKPK